MKLLIFRILSILGCYIFIANSAYAHCTVHHPHHCLPSGKIGPPTDDGTAQYFHDEIIGGVNLTPWCKSEFGSGFKAKLVGNTAGDWVCEQSQGNRRPILVTSACKLQYGNKAKKSKALNWSDPYSWKCISRERNEILRGVNLMPWCKSKFGSNFKAKLIGNTAGDWVCQQSEGNRRPISVKAACKLQYGSNIVKAKAINWNDPYSWKCVSY